MGNLAPIFSPSPYLGTGEAGPSVTISNQGHVGSSIYVNSNNPTYQDNRIDQSIRNRYTNTTNNFDGGVNVLLKPLSPLEALKRHHDICATRLGSSGTWLTESQKFLSWRNREPTPDTVDRILCCYGNPGAGKTVMSSLVIENLFKFRSDHQGGNIGVAVLYSDYRDHASQTGKNILGSLLQQLLLLLPSIPVEVQEQLVSVQMQRKHVETVHISQMLKKIVKEFHSVFVCIDAIDELDPKTCNELLVSLREQLPTAKMFLTGRPTVRDTIIRALKMSAHPPEEFIIKASESDIQSFLSNELEIDKNITPDAMNSELHAEILHKLTEDSKGMFLLPRLQIKTVLQEVTIWKRRNALATLPQSLDEAFSDMVGRILKTSSSLSPSLGERTLTLLHLAYRPLTLQEVQDALAVEPGTTERNESNVPCRETILKTCLGLVMVDEETSTVRFVHFTLEEHFKQHGRRYFPNGHSNLAELCLTYLTYREVYILGPAETYQGLSHRTRFHYSNHGYDDFTRQKHSNWQRFQELQPRFHFLEYAALHWGDYVRESGAGGEALKGLVMKLLRPSDSTAAYPCAFDRLPLTIVEYHSEFSIALTGPHVASYFGLETYVPHLIGHSQGRIELLIAVLRGHEGLASALLERGVDVNSTDGRGEYLLPRAGRSLAQFLSSKILHQPSIRKIAIGCRPAPETVLGASALICAAKLGHAGVVELLLARGANVESRDEKGITPCMWAAKEGHEGIVRLLLAKGADVRAKDKKGITPFMWAAKEGHEGVVRLLLAEEAALHPLIAMLPAKNGHEGVLRLLLERGADAEARAGAGESPLTVAAGRGREGVARLLLQAGVDVNADDDRGKSPLSYAAEGGHEDVARLLLQSGADWESTDKDHLSCFSYAASGGRKRSRKIVHEGILRLLVEKALGIAIDPEVEPSGRDLSDIMSYAAVASGLCEHGADPKAKYGNGRSLLSFAVRAGHDDFAKFLLDKGADLEAHDSRGKSPLSYAAESGHAGVVELLLARGANVESRDEDGRSPLSWAATARSSEVALGLLLAKGAGLESRDQAGRTPLSWAATTVRTSEAGVRLLLENGADLESRDRDGRSPLSHAIDAQKCRYRPNLPVLKFLLEKGANVNAVDKFGLSPLSRAVELGDKVLIELLRQHDGFTNHITTLGIGIPTRLWTIGMRNLDTYIDSSYGELF
ncbi:ankyrin repeat-containing domain protein [Peziza echinospora]|nr:ankyrin repeat-containing domain protein [Peziza echinospora]